MKRTRYFRELLLFFAAASTSLIAQSVPSGAQGLPGSADWKFGFYGHFSPTMQFFDDGRDSYSDLADNVHSSGRVGLNLDRRFQRFSFRLSIELETGAPRSDAYSQGFDPVWEWDENDVRKFEGIFSTAYGTISVGEGSMATDGAAKVDLSRTTMVGSSASAKDSAGSFLLRDGTTGNLSGVAIGDIYSNLDGIRRARIRYDTPGFRGFSAAFALGIDGLQSYLNYGSESISGENEDDGTFYDLALNYSGESGDFRIGGAIGYSWRDTEGSYVQNWVGSMSVLQSSTGLNGTFAAGAERNGGSYFYLKAGWIAELLPVGPTAFSVDYYDGYNFLSYGAFSAHRGVQVAQYFEDLNLNAYLGYRHYSYDDDTGVSYLDASSVLAGIRWDF